MQIRPFFFWLHLIAGVVAGAVILVMSVTGVLLTYERQMLARADRGQWRTPPPTPEARRISVDLLLARVLEQKPDLAPGASMTFRSDPREPVELGLGREGSLYIQPYSGQVLGGSDAGTRKFFQELRAWHRWLGASGNSPARETAKAVTGASNLAFLVLVCSGIYLWFPRKWTSGSFGAVSWFRGGLTGKARDFNWHNVIGFWTAVPLLFVVLSAVPISYRWGGDLIYRMTGTPLPKGPSGAPAEARGPAQQAYDLTGVETLLAQAAARTPEWRSISFRLPASATTPVAFTIDSGDGGQPQRRASLVLQRDGKVTSWEPFESLNAGRRLRSWTRFIHTGEAYGLAGQTIAGLVSLGGVFLVWTGISLSLRRFAAWRARRVREPEPADPVAA